MPWRCGRAERDSNDAEVWLLDAEVDGSRPRLLCLKELFSHRPKKEECVCIEKAGDFG
jgi:hypothetical protein